MLPYYFFLSTSGKENKILSTSLNAVSPASLDFWDAGEGSEFASCACPKLQHSEES